MEKKHLSYFKVNNFKRFDNLEVNNIGQFNLIVGDNNVGKTSLLEALLFDESNYNQFLSNIWNSLLQVRKLPFHNEISKLFDQLDTTDFVSYFVKDKSQPITYNFKFKDGIIQKLSIKPINKADLLPTELNILGSKTFLHQTSNFLVKITTHNNSSDIRYTTFNKEKGSYDDYYPLACFGLSYQHDLINFFSEVTKPNAQYDFITTEMRKQLPSLDKIDISTAFSKDFIVLAIREKNKEELMPISFYGDGLNKFFRYLLEIYLNKGKRLMIDEIDTGIHYSRMQSNFKSLIELAHNHKVQLFATTHSKECLEYYKEAIAELGLQEKARIISMVEHKDKSIKTYTYTYEQFEHSLNADNEIR